MLSFRLIVLIGLSSKGVFSDSCYQTPGLHSVYIKSIQCKFTDKYIYPNSTCYAKSFNRTCSTVTIKLITKSPLSNVFLKAQLYYKYGTIYREVMHTPLVDYCRMTGDTLGNPMIKAVMSVVEDSVPGLIHSCPYMHLNVSNANFRTGSMIISIFSSGDYKVFILGNFGKDENIGNITAFATVSSSNKDTFG